MSMSNIKKKIDMCQKGQETHGEEVYVLEENRN